MYIRDNMMEAIYIYMYKQQTHTFQGLIFFSNSVVRYAEAQKPVFEGFFFWSNFGPPFLERCRNIPF